MKTKLIEAGHLSSIVIAGRTCYNSFHLGGNYPNPTDNITTTDREYLHRMIHKNGHRSITRHIQYVFSVNGITTKTLLGSTRHGPGVNFSVMSSRFCKLDKFGSEITETPNKHVNELLLEHMQEIIELNTLHKPSAEDLAMLYPQAVNYNLVVSFNPQSLQHFFDMRAPGTHAHPDIQLMAQQLYDAIPESHKFMYTLGETK